MFNKDSLMQELLDELETPLHKTATDRQDIILRRQSLIIKALLEILNRL